MEISRNYSLEKLNTFGIPALADYFAVANSVAELKSILLNPEFRALPKMVLGGGSNMLLTKNYPGLIIQNKIKGIEILREENDTVFIKAGGGEIWHEFVMQAIEKGLGGVENLSLIPGSVGASPIQNIGAYGVELKDVFHELEAMDVESAVIRTFTKEECRFAYRDSIFKQEARNKFVITVVQFRLSRKPVLNTSYGAIETELQALGISNPGIRDVSQAVINIRRSKLPDPAEIGNAGSFFKNPEIPPEQYEELKLKYPEIPGYKTSSDKIKLAAGWMIEQCGWKGKRVGNVGMHLKQALVLVNYGKATGEELISHARKVQQSVHEKFGVLMEMEVNII